MKYTHVTRKISCDRKYTSCDKRSICHRRIFSCEINNISCDRKFISCDRNKKEHLVSKYTFPVNERIFTVTGNEYPVIGLGETHQSLNTHIWFSCPCPNRQGPSVHWSLDCVFLPHLFLATTLCWLLSWWLCDFSRCFRRNYLLENQVPRKFQILSHPVFWYRHEIWVTVSPWFNIQVLISVILSGITQI